MEELLAMKPDIGERKLLQEWYIADNNADPAEWCLQTRVGQFVDGGPWGVVESQLRSILRQAITRAGWSTSDPRRAKYELSLVHFEILKGIGSTPEAHRNVLGIIRDISGHPKDAPNVPLADPEIETLKSVLRASIPERIVTYSVPTDSDHRDPGPQEGLAEIAYGYLSMLILSRLNEEEAIDGGRRVSLWFEKEVHDAFARLRTEVFVGREDALLAISNYISSDGNRPLVLHGQQGSGKSAAMAMASQSALRNLPFPATVVRRFIGASSASSESVSLLESLCKEIAANYGVQTTKGAEQYQTLISEFRRLLALSTLEHPMILFLDGIDELDASHADRLSLDLPRIIPPYTKLILSAATGSTAHRMLTEGVPQEKLIELTPMAPHEFQKILKSALSLRRRRLNDLQESAILNAVSRSGRPLCLVLAINEATRWRSFDRVKQFPSDEQGLLDLVFERLEVEWGAVVIRALGYLAASRFGLSETELQVLLTLDEESWQDFARNVPVMPFNREFPIAAVLALMSSLQPYLIERRVYGVDVLSFSHNTILEAVRARYLTKEGGLQSHRNLALYFHDVSRVTGPNPEQSGPNCRAFMELAYQTAKASGAV